MANSGPNTNGSQFLCVCRQSKNFLQDGVRDADFGGHSITLAPTPWLDGKHTIFGRVKSGLRIVQRMGLVKTGAEDRPTDQVMILKARVVEEGEEEV